MTLLVIAGYLGPYIAIAIIVVLLQGLLKGN
jgi:hypothetical protein